MSICIYPGSFDPVSNGHLEIIERASKIFDTVYVIVSINPNKNYTFTNEERLDLLNKATKHLKNVKCELSDKLILQCAKEKKANVIIKGLRAITDFEYEFQMAQMNKKLAPDIETFFIVSNPKYAYLSSSAVKEVASLNGCIRDLVPKEIEEEIVSSFKNNYFD